MNSILNGELLSRALLSEQKSYVINTLLQDDVDELYLDTEKIKGKLEKECCLPREVHLKIKNY